MEININEIEKILPQKYPFLLIDRVIEFEEKKRIIALKNITANEHQFVGHFPGNPIMPGVLILEAMAQTAIVFFVKSYPDKNTENMLYYLGKVNAKFMAPVIPGDQLHIELIPLKIISRMGIVEAKAVVNNTLVARAELAFAAREKDK